MAREIGEREKCIRKSVKSGKNQRWFSGFRSKGWTLKLFLIKYLNYSINSKISHKICDYQSNRKTWIILVLIEFPPLESFIPHLFSFFFYFRRFFALFELLTFVIDWLRSNLLFVAYHSHTNKVFHQLHSDYLLKMLSYVVKGFLWGKKIIWVDI